MPRFFRAKSLVVRPDDETASANSQPSLPHRLLPSQKLVSAAVHIPEAGIVQDRPRTAYAYSTSSPSRFSFSSLSRPRTATASSTPAMPWGFIPSRRPGEQPKLPQDSIGIALGSPGHPPIPAEPERLPMLRRSFHRPRWKRSSFPQVQPVPDDYLSARPSFGLGRTSLQPNGASGLKKRPSFQRAYSSTPQPSRTDVPVFAEPKSADLALSPDPEAPYENLAADPIPEDEPRPKTSSKKKGLGAFFGRLKVSPRSHRASVQEADAQVARLKDLQDRVISGALQGPQLHLTSSRQSIDGLFGQATSATRMPPRKSSLRHVVSVDHIMSRKKWGSFSPTGAFQIPPVPSLPTLQPTVVEAESPKLSVSLPGTDLDRYSVMFSNLFDNDNVNGPNTERSKESVWSRRKKGSSPPRLVQDSLRVKEESESASPRNVSKSTKHLHVPVKSDVLADRLPSPRRSMKIKGVSGDMSPDFRFPPQPSRDAPQPPSPPHQNHASCSSLDSLTSDSSRFSRNQTTPSQSFTTLDNEAWEEFYLPKPNVRYSSGKRKSRCSMDVKVFQRSKESASDDIRQTCVHVPPIDTSDTQTCSSSDCDADHRVLHNLGVPSPSQKHGYDAPQTPTVAIAQSIRSARGMPRKVSSHASLKVVSVPASARKSESRSPMKQSDAHLRDSPASASPDLLDSPAHDDSPLTERLDPPPPRTQKPNFSRLTSPGPSGGWKASGPVSSVSTANPSRRTSFFVNLSDDSDEDFKINDGNVKCGSSGQRWSRGIASAL